MKIVYKITYPNGKIYVGKDLVYNINYFGSADGKLIEKDFTWEQQQSFLIKKEILWFSESASDREVNQKEVEFIRLLRSNDPIVGYNRWPKFGISCGKAICISDSARSDVEFLREEGALGSREAFDHYLAAVPDAPPPSNDTLED